MSMPPFCRKRPASRSITFWIASPNLLPMAVRLADGFSQRFPRTPIVFLTPEKSATTPHVCYRMPQHSWTVGLVLKWVRTQTLIHVGTRVAGVPDPVPAAYARGASLILLESAPPTSDASERPREGNRFDLIVDALTVANDDDGARCRAIDALIARSRRATRKARGYVPPGLRLLRFLRRHAGSILAMKFHEYRSISQLRGRLKCPDTILCLGNGPSSEDPLVSTVKYDSLFRVNISWQRRGQLAVPDLIFTGLAAAVSQGRPRAGFVFGKTDSEEAILVKHLMSRRVFSYASCERLGLMSPSGASDSAPTNGALMVALAAALNPRRLVISGIDLYSHPSGAYPDDARTPNAYAVGHDSQTEIGYLVAVLRRYHGELIVLSSALRKCLLDHGVACASAGGDFQGMQG